MTHTETPQPEFTLTPSDVASIATKRGVWPFWADRIRSMADHGQTITGRVHGDRTISPYTAVRVTKANQWPLAGTIALTRQDGAKVRLLFTQDQFDVEVSA